MNDAITMNTLNVANTIKNQLSRNTLFMLGAKDLIGGESYLGFKIRGSRKVTHIRITLDPIDTYTMEFFRVRALKIHKVAEFNNVYCDMLHRIIEKTTGLATSL